ncbi:MAG: CPBP family intramembrane metalloprotease [Deltaproteobacteria bacterium]|nr:CPBP family intramembrane metalloprotease [Deltaproteobacteria bacterium]
MPLTPEEKQILWLVQTGCSFGDAVSHSVERLGLPRPLVLRSLYAMYQLGMLTLVSGRTSSSASAVARGLYDPTLPMDLLVRNVQETDFFTLLGLTRQDEPGDVQSAFLRARAQVRSLTGDPKQLERILARLERALRCLADPAQRRIYLEQGEQALPGEQTVVRTTTPLPMDAAGVRFAAASTTTTSGHQLPAVQIPPRTEAPSRENISGGRTATPVPRTTSSLELLQAQNFEKARRHVESKQYGEALLLLRQLVKVAPVVGRYQAYLAWASYLDGKQTVEDTMATKNAMDQAIHLDLDDPDAYYFRGMLHARMEATRKAKQDLTLALDLNKEHTAAREALTRLGEAARKKTQQGDRRQLTIALGLFGLAFAVLFYAANFLGHDPAAVVDSWGAEEAYYHPTNWFFYARRGSLLLLGVLGSLLLFRREKSEGVGGKTFLGLCYGLVLGYLSYAMYSLSFPKDEVPGISLVMLMVVLHACADEFFFRGVVARAILPFFGQLLPGALIASLIYGLYHLSYVSYWWSLHYFYPAQLLGSMPVQVVSLSVTMGLPLTLLYAKSRSVVPGIFAQVAFGWVFLILTIYHAQG